MGICQKISGQATGGTRRLFLTVAIFRSWRGSKGFAAPGLPGQCASIPDDRGCVKSDVVAIISPFHSYHSRPLLTTQHQAYGTPLGNIEVDQNALAELQHHLKTPITAIPNDPEHSLEIELPFLQRVFKHNFKLLPIMVCAQEEDIAKQLGEALAETLKNKNAILVASTDLSHFYDQQTANILDGEMLNRFTSFEPSSIFEAEHTGKGFACGYAAVAAVQWAAKALGAKKVQVVNYATSGDVTGDFTSVVGYGAAVITK